jgi:chloramphenicol-sensitive protein RarD
MPSKVQDPLTESGRFSGPAGRGLLCGLTAYVVWGFFPVFFKAVRQVPPLEVVSHRIVWSAGFLIVVVTLLGKWGGIAASLRAPRTLAALVLSTALIFTNWLVFIFAVGRGEVLQSSLGYFITPLVNILLGFIFLRERLRPLQWCSLLLAVAGVLCLTVRYGSFPWIAVVLAFTFGMYGLIRKTVAIDSLGGLTVETLLAGPAALVYLLFIAKTGRGAFLSGGSVDILLPLAGVVTAIPLLLFACAARRLRLATMGFLQYITPTLHFLLAVLLYRETFTPTHFASFAAIWAGIALYSVDAIRSLQASKAPISLDVP